MDRQHEYSEDLQLSARERLLKEKANTWYQVRISLIATSLNFLVGITVGCFSSIARKIHRNELPFPTTEDDVTFISNFVSCFTLLGPICFTYTMNHLGRKATILLAVIPFIVEFVIVYFCNSIHQLMIGLAFGFIPGLITPSLVGVYVSEVTSPHLRGAMNSTLITVCLGGSLLGLVVNWLCSLKESSIIFIITAVVYAGVAFTIPESPYYYIRKNRLPEARVVLNKLYSDRDRTIADLEINRLFKHINNAKNRKFKDILATPKHRRSLFIFLILFFLKFFSGIPTIIWFSPILLSFGKYRYLSALSCEIFSMIISFLVGCIVNLAYRYSPRRRLGILSISLLVLAELIAVGYFHFLDSGIFSEVYDLLPFLIILFCKIAGVVGVVPLPVMYFRELTPVEYVAYYSLIVDFVTPVLSITTMFIFNYTRMNFGYDYCFGFFLCCATIGGVLFYLFVPETHKKIMERVQEEI